MWFSFCFLGSGEQHPQTRTQTKKRWGPALWLRKGLVALARAKLRKPQIKIRLHKEKQSHQSQHRTHKANASHKATNKKSRMQKRNSRPAIIHNKQNNQRASILHAALTENSRPLAGGYASVNRFARNGGRSLGSINPQFKKHQSNRYPQNKSISLGLLFCGYRLLCDLPPPIGG